MFKLTWRSHCLLALIIILGLLGGAYYLQYIEHLNPCPLCIIQRIFFALIGFLYLIGLMINPGKIGQRILGSGLLLSSLLGLTVALRHVWMTHLPPETQLSCIPNLEFLMDNFPLTEVFTTIFTGSADCATVTWTLFGLSLPEWSALAFLGFVISAITLLWKSRSHT